MSSLIPKGFIKKKGGKSFSSVMETPNGAGVIPETDPKPFLINTSKPPQPKRVRSKKNVKPTKIPIDIKTDIVYFIGKCETQHWRKGENIMSKDMKRRREKVLKYLLEGVK